jgi:hypothetical protein
VSEVSGWLDRWVDAGLLTAEQADAIRTFEQQHTTGGTAPAASSDTRPAPSSDTRPAPSSDTRPARRTLGVEAIGYVGAALAIGAVALLLGEVWDELVVAGRLALVALLTVLLGAGGLALRSADSPPLQRLVSVLMSGSIVGIAWLAFIVGDEVLGLRDADVALFMGGATTVTALLAYGLRRRALPQLTLLAAILLTVGALFARTALPVEPLWTGLAFWTLGLAWLLLGTGGWVHPRRVAEIAGGILGLVAVQAASFDEARLLMLILAVLTAGALVVLAISTDHVHHLAVGAVGLFVLVPQLAFELFGDAIGAPATLLVVGLLLVVLAVGLGRARHDVATSGPDRREMTDAAAHRPEGGEDR